MSNMNFLKNKNVALAVVAVIAIIIVGGLFFTDIGDRLSLGGILGMSSQQVGEKVINFINENQLSATPASLVSVSEESGLVKVKIKIGDQEFESYATKDGKILFPQRGIDMKPEENGNTKNPDTGSNSNKVESASEITKSDAPLLEAFIVSRCPYGFQMQRMMADAIKNIPALAEYVRVEYIGSVAGNTITAMHGEAEAKENLRQICIRDEQPEKYWAYVGCQMKASGTETSCEKSTGVNSAKLSACVSDPNKGVVYAKKDFDSADKYGATGSPTLVINGAVVAEFDANKKPIFGGRVSDEIRTIVCAAFNSQPSFCSTTLNTAQAATGFSTTYASSGSSAAAAANCE